MSDKDNSPVESFLGRFKECILDILALSKSFCQAKIMVDNYLEKYNNTYQYYLAGLSPREFYLYKMTGVYPCPEYFGIDAENLHKLDELIQKRVDAQRKRNEEERKRYARSREQEQQRLEKPPIEIVETDLGKLETLINKEEKAINKAEEKKNFLENIKVKAKIAWDFLSNASEDLMKELWDPFNWKNYPELSYVHDMNGLF